MVTRIIDILARHTTFPKSGINADSKLIADLGLNSYDIISSITEFEDEFAIEIPDKDIKKFQTIGDVAAYVEGRQNSCL